MFRTRWIHKLLALSRSQGQRRRQAAQMRRSVRLMLEPLEERLTPDTTALVAGNAAINFYGTSPSPAFTIPVAVNDTTAGGVATSGTVSISLVNGNTTTALGSATVGANGIANVSVTSSTLPASLQTGNYELEETYSGSGSFDASDAFGTLTISQDQTTVTAGNATVNFGSSSAFTISVGVNSPNGTVNSGTVSIRLVNGNTTTALGTATVSGGTATLSVTNAAALSVIAGLSPGNYQLTETFSDTAGGQFAGSSATGTLKVNAVSTTVVPGNVTVTFGSSSSFTISVAVNSPNSTVSGGTVTISLVSGNTTTTLGSATVGANGVANVSVTGAPLTVIASLPTGTFELVETFSGNSPFAGSSGTGTLTVTALPTTIIVGAPEVIVNTTTPFPISVAVTTPSGPATSGTVTFELLTGTSTIPLGTAIVGPNGIATITVTGIPLGEIAALKPGHFQLHLIFTGPAGGPFASTSTVGTLTVTPTPTPTTSVIPGNAVSTSLGGPTTIPVVVNSPSGPVDFGTVTITLVTGTSTQVIGTGNVTGGAANVSANIPSGLAPGNFQLIETFTDTTGHFLGSSATGALTIEPIPLAEAVLELAIEAAAIPLLLIGNTGAMGELQLFSEVFLHQPVPTSVPELMNGVHTLFPQTGAMALPAIGTAMFLAQELVAENPQG